MPDIESAQVKIDAFVSKWQVPLFSLCQGNNQKLACWYLWLRYVLGLRSLRHLCAANDLCGCYTIARGCMEYEIAIAAIAKKPELGDAYIGYDVHAKNRHIEDMKRCGKVWQASELEQYMASKFGPDFAKHKKSNWHGGFPKLCVAAEREDELGMYHALCQFAHGTITGMYTLNTLGMMGEHKSGESNFDLLKIYTLRYLTLTADVIEVLSPSWTQTKQDCSSELDALANGILGLD